MTGEDGWSSVDQAGKGNGKGEADRSDGLSIYEILMEARGDGSETPPPVDLEQLETLKDVCMSAVLVAGAGDNDANGIYLWNPDTSWDYAFEHTSSDTFSMLSADFAKGMSETVTWEISCVGDHVMPLYAATGAKASVEGVPVVPTTGWASSHRKRRGRPEDPPAPSSVEMRTRVLPVHAAVAIGNHTAAKALAAQAAICDSANWCALQYAANAGKPLVKECWDAISASLPLAFQEMPLPMKQRWATACVMCHETNAETVAHTALQLIDVKLSALYVTNCNYRSGDSCCSGNGWYVLDGHLSGKPRYRSIEFTHYVWYDQGYWRLVERWVEPMIGDIVEWHLKYEAPGGDHEFPPADGWTWKGEGKHDGEAVAVDRRGSVSLLHYAALSKSAGSRTVEEALGKQLADSVDTAGWTASQYKTRLEGDKSHSAGATGPQRVLAEDRTDPDGRCESRNPKRPKTKEGMF